MFNGGGRGIDATLSELEAICGGRTQRSHSVVVATLGWMIQSLRDRSGHPEMMATIQPGVFGHREMAAIVRPGLFGHREMAAIVSPGIGQKS